MNRPYGLKAGMSMADMGRSLPVIDSFVGKAMMWIADNARSFSYLLADSLELALYIAMILYFTVTISQTM
jgi:hypothetical protein